MCFTMYNALSFYALFLLFLCVLTPATFSNTSATGISWRPFNGERSRNTLRETTTMGKQLVNFITCGCESSAPFFCNLQSRV